MSELKRIPLSVVGGYLGAGKTTLINSLLSLDCGQRLAVIVNDFGSINIDATLLKSASEDTIELSNGCVCCTLSGDLFFTIGDLLERKIRPDHIIVEASGIADPAKIANVSLAEKELRYAGIVTMVDGVNIHQQLNDSLVSTQVIDQLCCADLLIVSKTPPKTPAVVNALESIGLSHWVGANELPAVASVLFDSMDMDVPHNTNESVHPEYVQWSMLHPKASSRKELEIKLGKCPAGVLRVKALLPNTTGGYWEVHLVGSRFDILERNESAMIGVTAIGIGHCLSPTDLERWWLASDEIDFS